MQVRGQCFSKCLLGEEFQSGLAPVKQKLDRNKTICPGQSGGGIRTCAGAALPTGGVENTKQYSDLF